MGEKKHSKRREKSIVDLGAYQRSLIRKMNLHVARLSKLVKRADVRGAGDCSNQLTAFTLVDDLVRHNEAWNDKLQAHVDEKLPECNDFYAEPEAESSEGEEEEDDILIDDFRNEPLKQSTLTQQPPDGFATEVEACNVAVDSVTRKTDLSSRSPAKPLAANRADDTGQSWVQVLERMRAVRNANTPFKH